jgi:hypothetical protein
MGSASLRQFNVEMRSIRFRGHVLKSGYDVQTDGRYDEEPASAPAV